MKSYTLSPLNNLPYNFASFKQLMDHMCTPEMPLAYNIEQTKDETYKITLAVPGFTPESLSLTLHNTVLTVKGNIKAAENSNSTYVHQGIAQANFEKSFQVGDFFVIDQAILEHGLLTITMHQHIPEEKKPKVIPIQNSMQTTELLN